jgi:hypothetical protein
MAYIGNSPANVGNYQIVDDIAATFNGVLTSFALTVSSSSITPAKSGQLLVGINGVMQEPDDTGTNGFKVSSSNIVFSSAPATGSTFWCVYQGQNVDIGTPSDATVGLTQLSATGTASGTTFLRGDNTWVVPTDTDTVYTHPTGDGNLHVPANSTTNNGKYLQASATAGTYTWEAVDALPTQTGNAGKYLGTDGTTATWNTLDTDANSTTKGLYEHEHTIDADYSITSGNNAMSAGPITISSGYSVTIPTGSTWVIV